MSLLFHERRFEARFRVKRFLVSQKRTFTSRVFRVSFFRELEKEAKKYAGNWGNKKHISFTLKTFGPKKVDVVVPARPRFTTQEEEEEED